MKRVFLETLKLTSFRNYSSLNLQADERHVVFTGENGAGKTNILEAISFLSPGRGLRRAPYAQVAQSGGNGTWAVYAQLHGPYGQVSIGTGLQASQTGAESQRKTHIDGIPAKTSDVLLDYARVLWLTPAMDGLFTGPAGDRRRFLDRLVLALEPLHGRSVSSYEKLLRSRNRVLSEDPHNTGLLDALETQLAEHAVCVAAARNEMVSLLSSMIARNHDPHSPFPDARLRISGSLEEALEGGAATVAEQEYRERLATSRQTDARAGRTLEGPHRSDLVVEHGPKDMAAELCSTGEQKALLTGLVLAHATLVSEISGLTPILLLDEIAAHLDEGRRAALYALLDRIGCQAWMTGTDRDLFKALDKRASFFEVDDGNVYTDS